MSDMSVGQIVGGIVGAVVGALSGGGYNIPGAIQGFAIGAGLGGVVDPPEGPTFKAPPDKQMEFQSSTYGAEKPDFYGTVITHGNVIYFENNKLLRTVRKEKQGGKGGGGGSKVEVVTYYGTWAVALGNVRAGAKVSRIWIGEKIYYDSNAVPEVPVYTGLWGRLASIIQSQKNSVNFTFYDGTQTTPNSRIASKVGAANAESYNGTMYIMLHDIDMTDYGNSLTGAQVKVEIVCDPSIVPAKISESKIYKENTGTSTLPPAIQGITPSVTTAIYPNWDNTYPPESTYIAYSAFVTGVRAGLRNITAPSVPPSGVSDSAAFYGEIGQLWPGAPKLFTYPSGMYQLRGDHLYGLWLGRIYSALGPEIVPTETPIAIGVNPAGLVYSVGFYNITMINEDLSSELATVPHGINMAARNTQSVKVWFFGGVLYIGTTSDLHASTQRITNFYTFNGALLNSETSFVIPDMPPSVSCEIAIYDGVLTRAFYQNDGHLVSEKWQTEGIETQGELLSEVIESVVWRSGVGPADIDTADISAEVVHAFASSGGTRGSIGTLSIAHLFDIIEDGYGLKCVKRRERPPAATIPAGDLIDANGISLDIEREMDGQLPSRYTLGFRDLGREQNQGTAIADYPALSRLEETADLPIGLTQEQGNKLADIIIRARHIERYSFGFTLPQTYIDLKPSDIVEVEGTDKNYLIRLSSVEQTYNQTLVCTGKLSSPALWESSAQAGDSGYVPPLVEAILDTGFTPIDTAIIYPEQDTYGFLSALYGAQGFGWNGGTLLKSVDGGQTYGVAVASTDEADTAEAINVLAEHSSTVIDYTSVLSCFVDTGEFSSVTIDQMLRGSNIAAYGAVGRWEIIGFVDAVEDGNGQTHLTTLARGMYGTEWATGQHEEGDSIVLLGIQDTPFTSLAVEGLGTERLYKAVSFSQPAVDVDSSVYTYTGENLKPYAPAYAVSANLGNDLIMTIQGRTRYPTSFWTSGLEPQNEPVISYQVDVLNGATVLRTIDAIGGLVTYTEADQIADWGAPVTTADAAVYQMSDRVGRGYPLYTSFSTGSVDYAVFDPSQKYVTMVLSDADKTVVESSANWRSAYLDTTKSGGKWYIEFLCGGSGQHGVGVSKAGSELYSNWCGFNADGWMYFGFGGDIWSNNAKIRSVGAGYTTGDVVGVALDANTGGLWYSKNGVWITGDPSAGTDPAATITGGSYRIGVSSYGGGTLTVMAEPGETLYPAPSGFNDGLPK